MRAATAMKSSKPVHQTRNVFLSDDIERPSPAAFW
jgi:hypothetical protein